MDADYTDTNPSLGALYRDHLETVMRRHDRALEQAGASHAVIYSGNPRLAFLDDYYHPFKANPHFVSWAPLTALPFSYVVYTPGETPVLIYYQPHDYWHVVPGEPDGYWTDHFDIRIVNSADDVAAHLPEDRQPSSQRPRPGRPRSSPRVTASSRRCSSGPDRPSGRASSHRGRTRRS